MWYETNILKVHPNGMSTSKKNPTTPVLSLCLLASLHWAQISWPTNWAFHWPIENLVDENSPEKLGEGNQGLASSLLNLSSHETTFWGLIFGPLFESIQALKVESQSLKVRGVLHIAESEVCKPLGSNISAKLKPYSKNICNLFMRYPNGVDRLKLKISLICPSFTCR